MLKDINNVSIEEVNEPVLNDNEVKIGISYCGLCGSDLHKVEGGKTVRPLKLPVTLGHEISGIIKEVGKNVTNFKIGDRVTADPNYACKECEYCKKGLYNHCENSKGLIKGMTDYVCCVEQNVYHIPDSLSLLDAALAEPVSCCIHGIDCLDVDLNSTVAVVGVGSIGLIIIQLLKIKGVKKIIALDIDDSKKEKAILSGADMFVNPRNNNYKDSLKDLYIDRIIECSGNKNSFKTCVDIACKHATIVIFGLAKPDDFVDLNIYELTLKELVIKGSIINLNGMDRAIEYLSNHMIDTKNIISKVVTPEEMVEEIYQRQLIKNGKVIVKWQ